MSITLFKGYKGSVNLLMSLKSVYILNSQISTQLNTYVRFSTMYVLTFYMYSYLSARKKKVLKAFIPTLTTNSPVSSEKKQHERLFKKTITPLYCFPHVTAVNIYHEFQSIIYFIDLCTVVYSVQRCRMSWRPLPLRFTCKYCTGPFLNMISESPVQTFFSLSKLLMAQL